MASEGARKRNTGKQKFDQLRGKEEEEFKRETEAVEKASRGWISAFCIALGITIVIAIALLVFMPSPIEPEEITGLSEPPAWTGPLEVNDVLSNAERIYSGKLTGPESIVVDGDHIYTGTADGWVYHIHKGVVERVVTFGKEPCGGMENENSCGRPLGMRMTKDGFLIVADAYYGLFKVNVVTGDYTTLYSSSTPINGKTAAFVNDLDIGPDGKIYFTDSSTRWHRNQFARILWEGGDDGRLLMYDPATGKTTQLADGFIFANGVQLTKDKSAVLVTETCRMRIHKYDLKTGKLSLWADNLPGTPDNIRYNKATGTYWVGLAFLRQKGKFSLTDYLAPRPWLRGIIAKVASVKTVLSLKKYLASYDSKTMAIELDENGKIIRSIQDRTGEVIESISEVESSDGVLYFGSFHATYIGRLYRKKVPGL